MTYVTEMLSLNWSLNELSIVPLIVHINERSLQAGRRGGRREGGREGGTDGGTEGGREGGNEGWRE